MKLDLITRVEYFVIENKVYCRREDFGDKIVQSKTWTAWCNKRGKYIEVDLLHYKRLENEYKNRKF